ncbi:MBOAT family O-acyltransferase [Aequorivita marina]|uniref:MBOAT family O-acyltransferase n=1 Tax=Aequorivita marina TaxID=3073654 RepID=UPI0028762094|nr:MBOAT family O-acyltransferase [Aequorivita sp. S2608]MDS1298039.1 MBOAT family O-acyltransferase [Aequorivita sp. S2608]
MLFNSLDFAIFLPIVFILYWFVVNKNLKFQNALLLLASYVFYGWWDWRFLSLLMFSTIVDYTIGLQMEKSTNLKYRKFLLFLSLGVNLGLLGFFKYYNFFIDNFTTAFTFFGGTIQPNTLSIILPVGISFYTFQTLSYTIDIYRRKIGPTKDFLSFAAFVSFFPQLVAGPIERASNLLPQFHKEREFDKAEAVIGVKQIIWGLFKKIVIADNCAQFANEIFANHANFSSATLIIGVIYFSFQIYCDFSGYSDIAIGTARLFNFKLMVNFRYPYFSRDIAEFWRRWHISLTTWFRDYVYIPLGGSRVSRNKQIRNVFIVFIVSGFWHGANWTFIVWGAINALFFIPLLLSRKNRTNTDTVAFNKVLPSLREIVSLLITYCIALFGWIFFRAVSVKDAVDYIKGILKFDFNIEMLNIERYSFEIIPLIVILLGIEWYSRNIEFPLYSARPTYLKVSLIIAMILIFGSFSIAQDFIYFQF